ncbi:ComEC/Rec2 family competence protein [Mucilaginibacter phyllosphaerae]
MSVQEVSDIKTVNAAVKKVFNLKFLPATFGDCILVEYGSENELSRVLVDGGTKGTRHAILDYMDALPEKERKFELVINTHYDKDHIDGILGILEMKSIPFRIEEIWFNSWKHLLENEDVEQFGAIMAEDLTVGIKKHQLPWNAAFEDKAVVVPVSGKLPEITLPGGLKLTILSPYPENLVMLKKDWYNEVTKKGKVPGYGLTEPIPAAESEEIETFGMHLPDVEKLNKTKFKPDAAAGNGSSIAVLAEYAGKSALLLGDALPPVILKSLEKLKPESKLSVDLLKLSHHGSGGNTGPELIEKLDCKRYVISTNGAIYRHPYPETMAWIIKRGGQGPLIYFNYKTDDNSVWGNRGLQSRYSYQAIYPTGEGIDLFLL